MALLQSSPQFTGTVSAAAFAGNGTALSGLWRLGGNSGTTPGMDFLGTSDNQPIELKVDALRALRLEPALTSPNLVGGYEGNSVAPGVSGAVIAGGGTRRDSVRGLYPPHAGRMLVDGE